MVHRWKDEPAFQATIVEIRTQKNDPLQATDAQSTGKGSAGAEAEELLRNALATGPVAMKDIQAEAKEAGLSWLPFAVPRTGENIRVLGVQLARIATLCGPSSSRRRAGSRAT
jgi:hypothetical protein